MNCCYFTTIKCKITFSHILFTRARKDYAHLVLRFKTNKIIARTILWKEIFTLPGKENSFSNIASCRRHWCSETGCRVKSNTLPAPKVQNYTQVNIIRPNNGSHFTLAHILLHKLEVEITFAHVLDAILH